MKISVLVLEDDISLNISITRYLESQNYEVTSVENGSDAIDLIDYCSYNIYVLDIYVPYINGFEVLKYIRQVDLYTPIIIITASLEHKLFVNCYKQGCSDFIKKPFHFQELEIRMNKLLNVEPSSVLFNDSFIYEQNNQEFIINNEVIDLRKKEKRFIEIMMDNIGKTVKKEIIIDYVWENEVKLNYPLRQLVSDIRKKLPPNIIKTEVGIGYKIEC